MPSMSKVVGLIGGVIMPGGAIVLSFALWLQGPTGISNWQMLVIAFAAGGIVMQQREVVTRLGKIETRLDTFQTKEGCRDLHTADNRARGAGI